MEKLDNSKLTGAEFFEWEEICDMLYSYIEVRHEEPPQEMLARYQELKQKQMTEK